MYVYISEQNKFNDFNDRNSLFWLEEELEYGDWTSGLNQDGVYTKEAEISLSEVCIFVTTFR